MCVSNSIVILLLVFFTSLNYDLQNEMELQVFHTSYSDVEARVIQKKAIT